MSILIRNGRIVTGDQDVMGDIWIEGETIRQIDPSIVLKADTTLDATGKLVIPGGIDPHTHLDMPLGSIVSSDDFETGTVAAACGGTTTIIDYAGQTKGHSMQEGLEEWHQRAEGKAAIDYGFHMMVCDLPEERLSEMTTMIEAGVTSFKFFTAYPERLYLDDRAIFRGMRKASDEKALICIHAENGLVIDELVEQALRDGKTDPKFHARTRPTQTEAEAVHRVAVLAEMAGAFLYIVHLSSADALEEVRDARKRGIRIFAESCPQYLYLDDSLYDQAPFEAAKYVMSPPLREKSHQEALWKGFHSGDLHCVGSDHCPFAWENKKSGVKQDFTQIPGGGPGIENRLSLLYHGGVAAGQMSIHRFVEITSTDAAKIFGLYPKKGTIAVGSDADLVIFDPNRTETIGVKNKRTHHMRVEYNFYEGMAVQGFPEVVLSRGTIVARDGQFKGAKGAGRYLKRSRPAESFGI